MIYPSFDNPPVVEVAIGVVFSRMTQLSVASVGRLHEIFRDRYPRVEERPPIEPVSDEFSHPITLPGGLNLRIKGGEIPLWRLWMISDDDSQLIQVQRDRLIVNWRAGRTNSVYPRFGHVRRKFCEAFQNHADFIQHEYGELPLVKRVEVTYINNLDAGTDFDVFREPWRALRVIGDVPSKVIGYPRELQFSGRYDTTFRDGHPFGYLEMEFRTDQIGPNDKRLAALHLTAVGTPQSSNFVDLMEAIDRGHEIVVVRFDELTTEIMKERWGRR